MSKKRNRQPDANCEQSENSTESGEESNTGVTCPHIVKAVNFKKVKKRISKDGIATSCSHCAKDESEEKNNSKIRASNFNTLICLQCGIQLCGKTEKDHAKDHHDTPHSDCHSIFLDMKTWSTQCYVCGDCKLTKKLQEVVDFTKKCVYHPRPITIAAAQTPMNVELEKGKKEVLKFPRVCGLANLGNTCFLNSVLQCLARTPFLLSVLESLKPAGHTFTLPGGLLNTSGEDVYLPPISGTLVDHWGRFTALLHETLTEMQDSPKTVSPDALLQTFTKKVPQCADGGQHDGHELLRHLLEVVRAEDLKRYQRIILNQLGLNKTNPDEVKDSLKFKVKFYGNQANSIMLGTEFVFGGVLVSTLECQDCGHCSQSKERFLDLSIPVAGDKPHPPMFKRKNNGMEETSHNRRSVQLAKAMSRRQKKYCYGETFRYNSSSFAIKTDPQLTSETGPNKIELQTVEKKDESDTDVEDNVELESILQKLIPIGYDFVENKPVYDSTVPPLSKRLFSNECQNGDNQNECQRQSKDEASSLESNPANCNPECLQNGQTNGEVVNPSLPLSPEEENCLQTSSQSEPLSSSIPLGKSQELTFVTPSSPSDTNTSVSNESLGSPDYAVVNSKQRLEILERRPVSRLEMIEVKKEGDDDGGWSQRKSRKKSDDTSTFCNGESKTNCINGTSSEVSTVLLQNLESPAKKGDDIITEDCNINGITTGVLNVSVENYEPARRYQTGEGECSIRTCLNQFTALELMTGSNKVGCEACTSREKQVKSTTKVVCTPATKQYLIEEVPPVLILHLKRFQAQHVDFQKVSKHVEFPAVLNLAPVCLGKPKDKVYALYGVVEHSGTIHGGHYVAYVKSRTPMRPEDPRWSFLPGGYQSHSHVGRKDSELEVLKRSKEMVEVMEENNERVEAPAGKWYYCSDSRVLEIDESTVLQKQAYLLFYERIL